MQGVIDFNLLKEYDSALKEVLGVWTKQKAYSINDTIQYKGKYLKCTTAGTTGITTLNFTGLDVGDTIIDGTVVWEIIEPPSGGADLPEWQANTVYTAGKYLVHEGTVYKVVNDFTSGTTFSDTNLSSYISPVMVGSDNVNDGASGLVPKPTVNDADKFLRGDGTWSAGNLLVSKTVLYSGTYADLQQGVSLTLTDNVNNYDKINFCGLAYVNPSDSTCTIDLIPTQPFGFSANILFSGNTITPNYVRKGSVYDSTLLFYIEGIKFTPTVSGIQKTLLWSGTHLTFNDPVTLNDYITNYDVVILSAGFGEGSCVVIIDPTVVSHTFAVDLFANDSALRMSLGSYCLLSSANVIHPIFKQLGTQFTSSNPCDIRFYGIKF